MGHTAVAHKTSDAADKPFSRQECTLAAGYALVLLWLNTYICRDLFRNETASMASMHGFWIALAKRADGAWFHATWWPYWDCGIPFEFAYQPLVPSWMAAWSSVRGVSEALSFNVVTGTVYCLVPATLFVMAWLLTRLPGYSF